MGWPLGEARIPRPVTLPELVLPTIDAGTEEIERREAAQRFAEGRIIKAGADAWRLVGKADSFENWCAVGKALSVGKSFALRATKTNRAWGATYSRTFGEWMKQYGFGEMSKSTHRHYII